MAQPEACVASIRIAIYVRVAVFHTFNIHVTENEYESEKIFHFRLVDVISTDVNERS